MRGFFFMVASIATFLSADFAGAHCVLVRTPTATPGCYGYVGYSDGVRVGCFHSRGTWVRSGSAAPCLQGGLSSRQIASDAVRLEDGTRIRLDARCENGQDF